MNTSLNSTNDTVLQNDENFLEPEPFRWVLRIIFISVFLVGSIGNLVVCSAVIRRKRMRTSNNIFTFNLAMSDLMIVLIYVPTQMAAFENNHNWPLGNFACQFAYVLIPVCLSASIATLLAITSDRYRAIAYPMKPKLTAKSIRLILFSIWSISFLVALPLVFVAGTVSPEPGLVYCDEMWPEGPYSVIYWISIFVIQYILPLGIILVLAILIVIKLRRNSLQMLEKTSKVLATAVRQRLRQSAKITNMLIALVLLYATCMLPQHIVYLLGLYGDLSQFKYRVYIIRFANVFPMANSAFNPIAYGLNKEFKAVFKNFFKCQFNKDPVDESHSEFSRSRRFRLAVYRHDNVKGGSILEYGKKWRRKSSASSRANWGAGLLERKNCRNGLTRTTDSGSSSTRRPNGHVNNNNSCDLAADCLVNLMDKQEKVSALVSEKENPITTVNSEETVKLLSSPGEEFTSVGLEEKDAKTSNNCKSQANNSANEKRTIYKKNYEHCNSDNEMKQCLLCSQSSTESSITPNNSTNQINNQTIIEDLNHFSSSLEWDPTVDGTLNRKINSSDSQPSNIHPSENHSQRNQNISYISDPCPGFSVQQNSRNLAKEMSCKRTDVDVPDVVSSPSDPILHTRKFDRNMFLLLESVRETVV